MKPPESSQRLPSSDCCLSSRSWRSSAASTAAKLCLEGGTVEAPCFRRRPFHKVVWRRRFRTNCSRGRTRRGCSKYSSRGCCSNSYWKPSLAVEVLRLSAQPRPSAYSFALLSSLLVELPLSSLSISSTSGICEDCRAPPLRVAAALAAARSGLALDVPACPALAPSFVAPPLRPLPPSALASVG